MGRDAPLLVLAEHPERVLEVGLGVHVHDLLLDDKAEVFEVEGGRSVVNLVHHVLHLSCDFLTLEICQVFIISCINFQKFEV